MATRKDDETLQIVDARFRETPQEQIDLENDADDAERAFLDEFQINDSVHEYYARLYRIVNGQKSFVEQVGPDKFPIEERLQKLHKGGHFIAMLFKDGKIWKNKTYRVEPPSEAPRNEAPSQIADIARLVAQQNEQIANIMQRGTPAAAPSDPIAQMSAIMAVMLQMKELMPQPKETGIKDFIELLTVAKELAGDSGGGRGVMDVLAEFVKSPIAGEIAEQIKVQRNAPVDGGTVRATPIPQAQIAPRPAQLTQLLANLDHQTIALLKSRVDFWITKAAKGSDPELYAELLLDDFPAEMVAGLIYHAELWPSILALNPQAAQYRAWFAAMIEAVNHMLTGGDDLEQEADAADESPNVSSGEATAAPTSPNVDPRRGGGRSSDAGNNAPVSPRRKEKPGNSRKGA